MIRDEPECPIEVIEAADFVLGYACDPRKMHWVKKSEVSRGDGWNQVLVKMAERSRLQSASKGHFVPTTIWKKCHSAHYYAWVDTREPNPYDKPKST